MRALLRTKSVADIVAGLEGGGPGLKRTLGTFDLDLLTTSGDRICVSVATSTVLGEVGAAILSFRDVTAARLADYEELFELDPPFIIAADPAPLSQWPRRTERPSGQPAPLHEECSIQHVGDGQFL